MSIKNFKGAISLLSVVFLFLAYSQVLALPAPPVLTGVCHPGVEPYAELSWTEIEGATTNALQKGDFYPDSGDYWGFVDFGGGYSYTDRDLELNKVYEYRAKSDPNVASESFFCDTTIVPKVETLSATNISSRGATLNSRVDPNGYETTAWFEYGTSESLGSKTSEANIGSSSDWIDVNVTVLGLDSGSTYYFQIVARNTNGTSKGEVKSFSTEGGGGDTAPRLTLSPSSGSVEIGKTISFKAYYDPDGNGSTGSTEVTGNASWSTSNAPILKSQGGGIFLGSAKGSAAASAVYQGKTATASVGVSTAAPPPPPAPTKPAVRTSPAKDITKVSAVFAGAVIPNGSDTDAWFEYGKSSSLGKETLKKDVGSGWSWAAHTMLVTLDQDATYYYRIVAENSKGKSQGQIVKVTSYGGAVLAVEPVSANVKQGDKTGMKVFYDSDGLSGPKEKLDVSDKSTWVSSDNSIASHESNSQFLGKSAGSVILTAYYNESGTVQNILDLNNLSAEAILTVEYSSSTDGNVLSPIDVRLGDDASSTGSGSQDGNGGGGGVPWGAIILGLLAASALAGGFWWFFIVWKRRKREEEEEEEIKPHELNNSPNSPDSPGSSSDSPTPPPPSGPTLPA